LTHENKIGTLAATERRRFLWFIEKASSPRQGVDRGWPYQVALQQDLCTYKHHDIHKEFNHGRSLCSRGHSVVFEDVWYNVFCYSLKEDAEAFIERFGGEWFDPRGRGKGTQWMKWYRGLGGPTRGQTAQHVANLGASKRPLP
jgi:hypothetical protein